MPASTSTPGTTVGMSACATNCDRSPEVVTCTATTTANTTAIASHSSRLLLTPRLPLAPVLARASLRFSLALVFGGSCLVQVLDAVSVNELCRQNGHSRIRGVLRVELLAELAGGEDDLQVLGQREESERDGSSGLAEPQHISFFAFMQIEVGEFKAVQRARDGLNPLPRLGSFRQLGGQQAQAGMLAPADASAQLVQL